MPSLISIPSLRRRHAIILLYRLLQHIKRLIIAPVWVYFKIKGITIIPITAPNRIGHLIAESSSFLREIELGEISAGQTYAFLDDLQSPIANKAYASLLSQKIYRLILPRLISHIFRKLKISSTVCASFSLRNHFWNYVTAIGSTATLYEIDARSEHLGPIFDKSEFFDSYSKVITSIGWNPNDPFVCIHARGPGYSPSDEHCHTLRNMPISNFIPAIEMLISQGINIVRMGDSSMEPLAPREGLFDYALSPLKSDINDLALASHALFFLGTPSGVYLMSYIFGVPVSCCNHCLPIVYSPTGRTCDLGMPKLVKRTSTNEIVHYEEVFGSGISEWRTPAEFEGSDYGLVENTPDEIRDFAYESLLRHTGEWADTEEDQILQECFSSFIRLGSYSYGSNANCSRFFMRKYSHLILN